MDTKEKVPAYEELESKMRELEQLATLCSRILDGCVTAFAPSSSHTLAGNDALLRVEVPLVQDGIPIITKLNLQADSINQQLMSIKASGITLENEIPNRLSGKKQTQTVQH